jgi:hypothetical protein
MNQPDAMPRRVPAHIGRHFFKHERSGLSIRAYCEKASLSAWTFYGWRRKYCPRRKPQQYAPVFQEIPLSALRRTAICEIEFPSGIKVTINSGAPREEIAVALQLLSGTAAAC